MRWIYVLLVCVVVGFVAYVIYDLVYAAPRRQAKADQEFKQVNISMSSWQCSLSLQLAQGRGELADSASNCDQDARKTGCRLYYRFPKHQSKIDPKDAAFIGALHHCAQPSDISMGTGAWMADPGCVCAQN